MDWWDSLTSTLGGVIEDAGETVRGLTSLYLETEITAYKETMAQPEVVSQLEPVKGTATDGSPIIATTANSPISTTGTTGNGFQVPESWLIGGAVALFLLGAMFFLKGAK